MPSLQELKASSPAYAGMSDAEFAQRVYQKHYAGKLSFGEFKSRVGMADFGNVQGGSDTVSTAEPDATAGMSGLDKFRAGMGKAFADSARGIKQAGTEALNFVAGGGQMTPVAIADRLVRGRDTNRFDNPATRATGRSLDRQQQAIDEAKRLDEPLMDTGAGLAGYAGGTLAQILVPGIGLRGSAAGAALLPRTIGANAAQGGVIGALQPVGSGDNRAQSAALGTAFGTVGAALPIGGSKLLGLLRRAGAPATLSGAERKAAELIAAESSGLSRLLASAPSKVPGVQRSLAEETLDPGIARLERQMRGQTNIFQPIDTANNAARVRALESFAGDDAQIAAAEAARDQATSRLRDLAIAEGDEAVSQAAQHGFSPASNIGALREQIDSIASSFGGRPTVRAALNDVSSALERADPGVRGLYQVRQYIGDLLGGKAGSDKGYAKAASKELLEMRDLIDSEIETLAPSFGRYLQSFRDMSVPINRMQTGQQLLARGSGSVEDPSTGLRPLLPASFSRAAGDLDATAASATGFRKAKAADILKPEDIAVIRAVQDDLERQAFRATAGSGGNSMTAERLALQDKIGSRLAGRIPVVGGFVEALNGLGQQRVNQRLAYLLANPEEARRVLAALNKKDRSTLSRALLQISARPAAAAPALIDN